MQNIPAGFIPDEWNQSLGSFQRLVQHLDAMQSLLGECSILTPENCDVAYIREQVTRETDTLQLMTSDAETRWNANGVAIAAAAGQLNLNRPADDVAWCSAILNAAWHFHSGLRRELSGENAELCVQRLPLHLGRIPGDIGRWQNRIAAELRAGKLCEQQVAANESEFSRRTFVNQDISDALAKQRSDGTTPGTATVERFIRREKATKRIDRDGNKPMRLRRDLLEELNLIDISD